MNMLDNLIIFCNLPVGINFFYAHQYIFLSFIKKDIYPLIEFFRQLPSLYKKK